jgi:small-conductance mechanosensitive channel
MENIFDPIKTLFAENSMWLWPFFCAIAVLLTLVIKLVLRLISSYLRKFALKTKSSWDDVGVDIIDGLNSVILFLSILFLITRRLEQTPSFHQFFLTITILAMTAQVAIWGLHVIKVWRRVILDHKIKSDPSSSAALGLLYKGIQISFISVLILIGLSNLGIDISALLAGLGVGGIAVALAAQNVLGDLLASLSIVLDKPFVVGDFIVAGSEKGTVEHIGIKTTRLRSLSGEELIFSNKDLLESRVQNFKRMWVRRVVQNFGVTYSTTAPFLEKIPTWVRQIVEGQPQLKFDRCHFSGYGAYSLDFELVFFVQDPEYNVFMDLQQIVLLEIFKKFTLEKIDFAFPTQSIHVEKLPPAPEGRSRGDREFGN